MKSIWVCVVVLFVAGPAFADPSYNLSASLDSVKERVTSGGQASILVLGDSLSFNNGSYLPYFTNLLQNAYGNAGAGYQGMSLWTGGGFNAGWSGGVINGDTAPHHSLDGLWDQYDGSAAWPNQAFLTVKGQTAQVQYVTQPGGGSFNLSSANGPVVTISTNGPANVVQTYTYTLPAGNNQLAFIPHQDGPLTILGAEDTTSASGFRVDRAANGGWGVNDFLQRDSTFDSQVSLLKPDLVMVWLGQNDQGYDEATYKSKMESLVDRIKTDQPTANVVLVASYDSGSSAIGGLAAGMEDAAKALDVGFINIYSTAGDYAFFQQNGYLLPDGIHFSSAGGQYVGHLLFNAFQTDGASLVPEPASCGLLLAGFSALLYRRPRRRNICRH